MHRFSASLQKKIPHPVHQFGSIQASASLEVELPNDADPVAQAEALFRRLDAALDRELQRQAAASPVTLPPSTERSGAAPASAPSTTSAPPVARPYTKRGHAPAPVTESQLKYLDRLIVQTGTDRTVILRELEVADLRALSCKEAAGLIDDLKAKAQASGR